MDRKQIIGKTLKIINTVITFALAVALTVGVVLIYSSGENPYTYEKFTRMFYNFSWMFILYLVFIIGSGIYFSVYDYKEKREKMKKTDLGLHRKKFFDSPKAVFYTKMTVLSCASVFIIAGAFTGQINDVIEKAIKICTECIGLG